MVDMLGLVVSLLSLAWVSVFVRFWVKIFLTRSVRWDDWMLLLAMVLFSGLCGCVLVMTNADHNHLTQTRQTISYMFVASYNLSIMISVCVKTSLAISLNRFFAKRWQRVLVITMTVMFNAYAISEMFLGLFFCGLPGDMARKDSLQQCTTWSNMLLWWLVAAIFNAITDWIYILLPATVVWTSCLSRTVKMSVSFVTIVGALSGTAAIVRALGSGSFTALRNFNPANLTTIASTVLELGLGIIATSMANSTQLPAMLDRGNRKPDEATNTTGMYLSNGDTDIVKLSPIICPQKKADDNTWSSGPASAEDTALGSDVLALPTPSGKANRFSWSRTFGGPASINGMPARLTLLIDDISDDEEDLKTTKGSQQAFSNI